jgi:hypothetical protein
MEDTRTCDAEATLVPPLHLGTEMMYVNWRWENVKLLLKWHLSRLENSNVVSMRKSIAFGLMMITGCSWDCGM